MSDSRSASNCCNIAFALLALLLPHAAQSAELNAKQLFAMASPSVVRVHATHGASTIQGSGVVLSSSDENCYIVTNAHVVGDTTEVTVVAKDIQFNGKVITSSERHDLAIVLIKGVKLKGVQYSTAREKQPVNVGDRVYAIGSPSGLTNTLSDGLVSGLRQRSGVNLIQTTASISPGSSGGALLNQSGMLIGITTFKLTKGEDLNFAVDVKHIEELLSQKNETVPKTEDEQQSEAIANLTSVHSDWEAVVKSPQFKSWVTKLPHDEQAKLNKSWDWRFIASKITQYKELQAKAKFTLVCQVKDPKTGLSNSEQTYRVDENESTVNGHPAETGDTSIYYTEESEKYSGEKYTIVISRVTGLITVDNSKFGRLFEGRCQRFSGDRAF